MRHPDPDQKYPSQHPGVSREMEADALRKGETERTLCELHPDEHHEACGNEVERASAKAMREHEARHPECKAGCSVSGWVPMPACPVCTLEANEKSYDRKARLAEHAEELFRFAKESLPAVRAHAEMAHKMALENGSGTAIGMAQQAAARADWLAALVSKIDNPEEGTKP